MKKIIFVALLVMSVANAAGQRIESFPLRDVTLLDGEGNFSRWRDNQRLDSAWIFSLPVSRLLHTIRTTAGAYSAYEGGYSGKQKIEKLGGWESLDCDLRGHAIGHLLSAYALMSVALPSEKGRQEAKEKGDSLVRGIRECQQLIGTGYVAAFPEGLLRRNLSGKSVLSSHFVYNDMPFTEYSAGKDNEYHHTELSADGRGNIRPCWEIFYAYAKANGLSADYCGMWSRMMRAKTGYGDGGAGDYGTSSGGYDQLGYGALMFAIPESPSTGIQATEQQKQQNSPAYDLRGIRIREEKGILIKNGMKVVR